MIDRGVISMVVIGRSAMFLLAGYGSSGSGGGEINSSAGREVDALTNGGWTGSAASFGNGWNECRDDGTKIIDALTTMASSLGVTADSYRAQDNQFASEVSSLDLP